jgi:hypothetical protein
LKITDYISKVSELHMQYHVINEIKTWVIWLLNLYSFYSTVLPHHLNLRISPALVEIGQADESQILPIWKTISLV